MTTVHAMFDTCSFSRLREKREQPCSRRALGAAS